MKNHGSIWAYGQRTLGTQVTLQDPPYIFGHFKTRKLCRYINGGPCRDIEIQKVAVQKVVLSFLVAQKLGPQIQILAGAC